MQNLNTSGSALKPNPNHVMTNSTNRSNSNMAKLMAFIALPILPIGAEMPLIL
jgi:hypothetical protein